MIYQKIVKSFSLSHKGSFAAAKRQLQSLSESLEVISAIQLSRDQTDEAGCNSSFHTSLWYEGREKEKMRNTRKKCIILLVINVVV